MDSVPEDTDVEKLMLAYEADIYVPMKLDAAYQLALSAEVPIVMTCGIIRGKLPKNITLSPLHHTVKNMVGTFQLLEDE